MNVGQEDQNAKKIRFQDTEKIKVAKKKDAFEEYHEALVGTTPKIFQAEVYAII